MQAKIIDVDDIPQDGAPTAASVVHDLGSLIQIAFTTAAEGAGLGPPMVLRFTCAAGGRAEIRSTPGEGTIVTLRLPGAPVAKAAWS